MSDMRALSESIDKEMRLRQRWEDTYGFTQSATLSNKLGLRGFTPLTEKPNARAYAGAAPFGLDGAGSSGGGVGPHRTRPHRGTPMATPPQRSTLVGGSAGKARPPPLREKRAAVTPLPPPPQRVPQDDVMSFIASSAGTAGGDGEGQAEAMVLNLENPEESTLEVLQMELAKLEAGPSAADVDEAVEEVGTLEEEALTKALLAMAPPAFADAEGDEAGASVKRRFKVKWPLAS